MPSWAVSISLKMSRRYRTSGLSATSFAAAMVAMRLSLDMAWKCTRDGPMVSASGSVGVSVFLNHLCSRACRAEGRLDGSRLSSECAQRPSLWNSTSTEGFFSSAIMARSSEPWNGG